MNDNPGDGEVIRQGSKISWLTFTLVCIFSMSSWIGTNGIWVETPLLVARTPGGLQLPAVLTIISHLGAIGPACYGLAYYYHPRRFNEAPFIYILLIVAVINSLALAIFWNKTFVAMSTFEHSVALYFIAFIFSFVGCMSIVTFLPYMADYPEIYITGIFIGDGLSSLIPGIAILIQDVTDGPKCHHHLNISKANGTTVSENPIFGPDTLFFIVFTFLLISLVSFTVLDHLPSSVRIYDRKIKKNIFRMQRDILNEAEIQLQARNGVSTSNETSDSESEQDGRCRRMKNRLFTSHINDSHYITPKMAKFCLPFCEEASNANMETSESERLSTNQDRYQTDNESNKAVEWVSHADKQRYIILLLTEGWAFCISNGVLPSIQPFSCLPYGLKTYHRTVASVAVTYPLSSVFAVLLFKYRSMTAVFYTSTLSRATGIFIITSAVMSPYPPLHNTVQGSILIVRQVRDKFVK
ncbi:uncharacterized protein TRIADDRAFT_59891 [Trichoplax adhaerens]|uniref:Riboflavin transporter n=1 Tax=Trichoplax adhaerens TaxID=10228 RepID=B3S6Q7_TRIAD|nr:hypothetical protein TRIADDRAFT_59891 [Trichoplax adhaerens]EDV21803.1 hypothetical protein TRIADDRAFT_59891 [Trichoplax adhaerens]|eukprot:XP_002115951.1 hypothetical protein TRIADDRAFT_59891 [Trichoplax adhaerens]